MGEAGGIEQIRQPRRNPGVGIGGVEDVNRWFMHCLPAEKGCLVRVLSVNQGDEPKIRKLLFAAVGEADLR